MSQSKSVKKPRTDSGESKEATEPSVPSTLTALFPPRVVLVTGGGSGIGKATVLAMAREWGAGCHLVVVGRQLDRLEDTVAMLTASGASGLAISADLTDEQQVRGVFEQVKARFGRLDVLLNNAGKSLPGTPIEELELKDFEDVVRVNLTAPFMCTKYAIRMMKEQQPQGGRIINNGSLAAHTPRPEALAYTCSKHAISGLTKSTALEGRQFNIACGQVDIGNTVSDMTVKMSQGMLQADGSIKPEPVCDVEDIARAVLYMASLPLTTNVLSMSVMATTMPFVGRG